MNLHLVALLAGVAVPCFLPPLVSPSRCQRHSQLADTPLVAEDAMQKRLYQSELQHLPLAHTPCNIFIYSRHTRVSCTFCLCCKHRKYMEPLDVHLSKLTWKRYRPMKPLRCVCLHCDPVQFSHRVWLKKGETKETAREGRRQGRMQVATLCAYMRKPSRD